MAEEIYFDCLIMGAGISGLDMAYHIQKYCPWASYAILERRANLGGTWDFFKYPGKYITIFFFFLKNIQPELMKSHISVIRWISDRNITPNKQAYYRVWMSNLDFDYYIE